MDRVGNSQTDNAINLSLGSNSKTGTSSTAMNVSEAQSAFGGESHEARPQEWFLTRPFQRTVKTIGAESNQSCDQLESTLNNALVPYTGEQSRASVLTLKDPDAERILLIEEIHDAVKWKNWDRLDTLLNSEISSDLTERELMNVCEKIYVEEGLKCSGLSQADVIFFFIVGEDQAALLKLLIKIDFFAYFCELRKDTFYPLDVAMQSGRINIAKLLLVYLSPHVGAYEDETLRHDFLVCAVEVGDVESAQSLIIAGVKVNYSDKDKANSLPLDIAMDTCNTEMIMLLLEVGKADPNKWRVTPPLLRALAKNDVRCTELLLRAGATVNYDSDRY